MDDKFLYDLRAEPSPEFARSLRARLKRQGQTAGAREGRAPMWRLGAVAAAVTLTALLFVFPSVRASAQAFLDLFRVVNFTAVPVGIDRLKQLESRDLDLERLIGDQVQTLTDPGPPQPFLSPEAAGAAAGFRVRLPSALPAGLVMTGIQLQGEHAVRVTADTVKLQQVLDALDIHDLRAPEALNGQAATVRVPPIVSVSYQNGEQHLDFVQGRSPEVSLPAGVDLPVLGEIGLRVLGLEPGEAHRLAQAIDWHTTLLVPVPANATSFRQVEVSGNRGLLVEAAAAPMGAEKRPANRRLVLWSEGGYVYGMGGPFGAATLLNLADSVQ